MTSNYNKLIQCVKQTVNTYERIEKNRKPSITKAELKRQMFWELGGIHQTALFILSLEEYYKFKEECREIEGEHYELSEFQKEKQKEEKQQSFIQMTLF